jgi:menaquinone-dependent protoporphyrinogen oxidase
VRVLVSVASRHSSTSEIGTAIARVLEAAGIQVDVVDPELVTSVEPYDGVVLGSAVYAGRWLAPARELVDREVDRLRERHVWLVSSGPIGNPPKPEQVSPDATAIHGRIGAVDHQVFEGRLDRSRLGVAEKLIVSAVRAEPGDYRPWDAVVDWARWIASTVKPERSAPEVPVTAGRQLRNRRRPLGAGGRVASRPAAGRS